MALPYRKRSSMIRNWLARWASVNNVRLVRVPPARRRGTANGPARRVARAAAVQSLEDRCLLSGHHGDDGHGDDGGDGHGDLGGDGFGHDGVSEPEGDLPEAEEGTIGGGTNPDGSTAPFPLGETFNLSSLPGADHTIYLDFDGHVTSGTAWNNAYGPDFITPAYSIDGDAAFSDDELARIQVVWQRVVEDFAPFEVNVTTLEPAAGDLVREGASDGRWGVRVAVGGSASDWYSGGAGGVAYVGSFNWNNDTPTYVFTDNLGNGNAKFTAEAASHEIGHTLGLRHDGTGSQGYYRGHGDGETGWAPIMGVGYYENLSQWSRGEYAGANQTQDDLAIITGQNGFGYRADDVGDSAAAAAAVTALSETEVEAFGLIETSSDVDVFSFSTGAGAVSLDVLPFEVGPNLDILAELYDASGALVAASNPADLLSATVDATLAAGEYFLHVSGTGKGDPLGTGYTDYGSLGQYTIGGTVAAADAPIVASIEGGSALEGEAVEFTVTLSGVPSETVSVDYETEDFTARSGTDFAFTKGRLTFGPGETVKTVLVPTLEDSVVEGAERFRLFLSNPIGVELDGEFPSLPADGIILDATTLPELSVSDAAAAEGEDLVFEVRLSEASPVEVTATLATVAGTAEAAADYEALTETVTFAPGETVKTVRVATLGDADDAEGDETVGLSLVSVSQGVAVADGEGLGTIADVAVVTPQITVTDASADEGSPLVFRVDLSEATTQEVFFNFAFEGVTATAGDDYVVKTGGVRFFPGDKLRYITLDTVDDSAVEPDETVELVLSNVSGAVAPAANAVGTILNDDEGLPTLDITGDESDEGDALVFTVTVSEPSPNPIEFDFATSDVTAVAGADYDELSGRVTLQPNTASIQLVVFTTEDSEAEPDETLEMAISNATGAQIGQASARGVILNDDGQPPARLTVTDVSAPEGEALVFRVLLSEPADEDIRFDFAFSGLTATAGEDFSASSGGGLIRAGDTFGFVTTSSTVDALTEDDETIRLTVTTDAAGVEVVDGVGIGTILDDDSDARPDLTVLGAEAPEGEAVEFPVTLSAPAAQDVTLSYRIVSFTATPGADFDGSDGTLTIPSGQTTATLSIDTFDDPDIEADERFRVVFEGAPGADLAQRSADGVILDDDTPTVSVADAEVAEGGVLEFVVSLSKASPQAVTVDYATAGFTALSGSDFTAAAGTVTFGPGETTATVLVSTVDDSEIEFDEAMTLRLSNPVGAVFGRSVTASGAILNDDSPTVTVSDPEALEGGDLAFVFTLSEPGLEPAVFRLTTADVTAEAGADYEALDVILVIPAGETSRTVSVLTLDDAALEGPETLRLTVAALEGASPANTEATGTILDRDLPTARATARPAVEGQAVEFTVTLSEVSPVPVTVDYDTIGRSATAGVDFTPEAGTLTFAPGETTKTVLVATADDAEVEADETLVFRLTGASGAEVGTPFPTGVILDNDRPRISVEGATAVEGGDLTFEIVLSEPAFSEVTASYVTRNFSAIAGEDFEAAAGTVVFAPGETSKLVTVRTLEDDLVEDREEMGLELTAVDGATINTGGNVGNILDNDAPAVSVSDAEAAEGGALEFTVTLSQPAFGDVTVDFATADGTAAAGADYDAASGTLTFAAGETSKTVTVATTDDAAVEPSETLSLTLAAAAGATIADATGVGTILDNDVPAVSVSDAEAVEGGLLEFDVTLSEPGQEEVVLRMSTSGATAVAGADYEEADVFVVFEPGRTLVTVRVATLEDGEVEGPETLTFSVDTAEGATVADGQGVGTILDDDRPTVSVSDAEAVEGGALEFTVTLSQPAFGDVTVDFATADGTAAAGADYAAASGTLTFAAGETTKTVTVQTTDDAAVEPSETLSLTLSRASGATTDDATGVGTILDNDVPAVSVSDAEADEGGGLAFTVTLSEPAFGPVTVDFATADGTAVAGEDYTARQGTLTFAAGETGKTVTVFSRQDAVDEPDETFTLNLSGAAGATPADASGEGVILDNDIPTARVGITAAAEGEALEFTVSLSQPSFGPVSVDFATVDGTALAGADYEAASGTLTFEAGETRKTVRVQTTQDGEVEPSETLTLVLSNGVGVVVGEPGEGGGRGTISDDDLPEASVSDASAEEGEALEFLVTLSQPAFGEVTVSYETNAGTAGGDDFEAASGTVVFAPGETSKTVLVQTTEDGEVEPDETLTLSLRSVSAGRFSDREGTGLILNDDEPPAPPTVSVSDASVEEGGVLSFAVTLSEAAEDDTSVEYVLGSGTATAGEDFVGGRGTVVIPAGQTSATVSVQTIEDAAVEADETLSLTLEGPSGLVVGDGQAVGTILNDDAAAEPPRVSIGDASGVEGDEFRIGPWRIREVTLLTFTVSLSGPSAEPVSVDFATRDGSAKARRGDYLSQAGTLTFAPGETEKEITVWVLGDNVRERTERFWVKLFRADGAEIADNKGRGLIFDNDGRSRGRGHGMSAWSPEPPPAEPRPVLVGAPAPEPPARGGADAFGAPSFVEMLDDLIAASAGEPERLLG